jgi:hypothetical protein
MFSFESRLFIYYIVKKTESQPKFSGIFAIFSETKVTFTA